MPGPYRVAIDLHAPLPGNDSITKDWQARIPRPEQGYFYATA